MKDRRQSSDCDYAHSAAEQAGTRSSMTIGPKHTNSESDICSRKSDSFFHLPWYTLMLTFLPVPYCLSDLEQKKEGRD